MKQYPVVVQFRFRRQTCHVELRLRPMLEASLLVFLVVNVALAQTDEHTVLVLECIVSLNSLLFDQVEEWDF
jgi:hypothetical protein